MSIEELTKRRNEYNNTKYNKKWEAKISGFMTEVINTFKSQSEEITKSKNNFMRGFKGSLLEARIKIIEEILDKLDKRIKKLERKDSYYPMTEVEIKNIKVGGTD